MNLWVSQQQPGLNDQAKDEEQEAEAAVVDDEGVEEPQEASDTDSWNHN